MTLREEQIKKLQNDVIHLYKKRKNTTDISIKVGVSYQRVWQIIKEYGSGKNKNRTIYKSLGR